MRINTPLSKRREPPYFSKENAVERQRRLYVKKREEILQRMLREAESHRQKQ